jgi:ParB-like chromosome segregation protein Spo0J
MQIKIHAFAELFPLLDEKSLQELAEDIKQNGQQIPILACRGTIIDGRNRLKACEIAGVEPIFLIQDELSESEIVATIVSANLHRRHLTTQQRAHIAAELANGARGGDRTKPSNDGLPRPPTIKQAAVALNVSPASVERAAQIKRADPKAHKAAMRGEGKVRRQAKEVRSEVAGSNRPAQRATSDSLQQLILAAVRGWLVEHPDVSPLLVQEALGGVAAQVLAMDYGKSEDHQRALAQQVEEIAPPAAFA